MKRQALLDLLSSYDPCDPDEVNYKKIIINFVNNNPRCFERSLEQGHMTASAWLLNKDWSKAFLMHHAKLNKWLQPGGHCDGESDLLSVALKEAREESGVFNIEAVRETIFDIDVHAIPADSKNKNHWHYDIRFLLYINSDDKIKINAESKDFCWIEKDINFLPTHEPSILRMFYKWKA